MRVSGPSGGDPVMVKSEYEMDVAASSHVRHAYGPAMHPSGGLHRMRPYSAQDRPYAQPGIGRAPSLMSRELAEKPISRVDHFTSAHSLSPSRSHSLTDLSSGGDSDVAGQKRELRLLKNREAAKECRRKKKEYVHCLENRVAVLEAQNRTLIEELKQLKDLYCIHTD